MLTLVLLTLATMLFGGWFYQWRKNVLAEITRLRSENAKLKADWNDEDKALKHWLDIMAKRLRFAPMQGGYGQWGEGNKSKNGFEFNYWYNRGNKK
jgi:hypothetical protein